jgi:hypothetical protein
VGTAGRLEGWAGDLGRDRARHDRRLLAHPASGADVAGFLDAAAPALLVAQAIGRIGNYFNQELFGRPTDVPWALEIGPEHRPARYLAEPTFHPDVPVDPWRGSGGRGGASRCAGAGRGRRRSRRRVQGLP